MSNVIKPSYFTQAILNAILNNTTKTISVCSYNIKINPEFDYYQSLIRSLNRNESGSVIISTRKLANLKNTLKYLEIYL